MDQLFIIRLGQELMFNSLVISLPLLGIGMIVGIAISVLQSATQIQEQTLTIVPKLVVVGATLILIMPWLIERVYDLTMRIFLRLPEVAR